MDERIFFSFRSALFIETRPPPPPPRRRYKSWTWCYTVNGSRGGAIIPLMERLLAGKKPAGIWKVSSSPWKFLASLASSEVARPSRNGRARSKVHECRNILGRVTPCYAISRQATWNGMHWLRELISRIADFLPLKATHYLIVTLRGTRRRRYSSKKPLSGRKLRRKRRRKW